MFNTARTLLLNLPYAGNPSDQIPSSFNGVILPTELQNFHNVLFPAGYSRNQLISLGQIYLNIIQAAGLYQNILNIDDKITYDLASEQYFKYYRNSVPLSSNPDFGLVVTGNLTMQSEVTDFYKTFVVTQSQNTSSISIYSSDSNLYLTSNSASPVLTPSGYTTLTFGSQVPINGIIYPGASQGVPIFGTNLTIYVTEQTYGTFTSASNTQFNFRSERPYYFDYVKFFNTLQSNDATDSMLSYQPSSTLASFQNYWISSNNTIYQTAGLLLAYIYRVYNLWLSTQT